MRAAALALAAAACSGDAVAPSMVVTGGSAATARSRGAVMTVDGATVLCGNIPTANATVYVIDTVLMPPA